MARTNGDPQNPRLPALPSRKRLALGILVGLAAISPAFVGVISIRSAVFPFSVAASGVLAVLAMFAWGPNDRPAVIQKLIVVLVALSLSFTLLDLFSRIALADLLYYRPNERFLQRWPPMPLTSRYMTNVSYEGRTYGDLAAVSGDPEHREHRDIHFDTDAYGFRNVESNPQAVDLILLGDSFGVGTGITQEQTWDSILAQDYGLTTYNLSTPGSPWQEYANLSLEIDRLDTRAETVVLWAIFTGNDLEGDYHPYYEVANLPWNNRLDSWVVAYQTFRFRSPIRLSLRRLYLAQSENPVIEREFPEGSPLLFYAPYEAVRHRTLDEVRQKGEFPHLEATVTAMKDLADDKDITVVIVLLPSKEEVYSWVLEDNAPWSADPAPSSFSVALQEVAQREGLHFLDLKPLLIEESERAFESSGELLWWSDDSHWNARGHQAVAEIVFTQLCLDSVADALCCQC